jgi:hypothetical protein
MVGRHGHLPAKSINLSGDGALAWPANAAVAGQVANSIETKGQAGGFEPHSCAGKSSFNPGVSGSNDNDLKIHQS